jgi:hypothetical protein
LTSDGRYSAAASPDPSAAGLHRLSPAPAPAPDPRSTADDADRREHEADADEAGRAPTAVLLMVALFLIGVVAIGLARSLIFGD